MSEEKEGKTERERERRRERDVTESNVSSSDFTVY